jgi:hypothetical protein
MNKRSKFMKFSSLDIKRMSEQQWTCNVGDQPYLQTCEQTESGGTSLEDCKKTCGSWTRPNFVKETDCPCNSTLKAYQCLNDDQTLIDSQFCTSSIPEDEMVSCDCGQGVGMCLQTPDGFQRHCTYGNKVADASFCDEESLKLKCEEDSEVDLLWSGATFLLFMVVVIYLIYILIFRFT